MLLAQLLIIEMSLNVCYMLEYYANAQWLPRVMFKRWRFRAYVFAKYELLQVLE